MTPCQDVQSRLSEYADGALPPGDRAAVTAHLAACSACGGMLADVQKLRAAAAALGPVAPPDHVWLQVAGLARLERPSLPDRAPRARVVRRAAISQWIGLAAALVVVTIGAHYFLRTVPENDPSLAVSNPAETPSVQRIADSLAQAMKHYDDAITELEALARANGGALDAQMADALRQNIQTVDAAIDESRAALVQNPGSDTARMSLFEALRRKVVVLQATVNLMNEMRKGNQTGAVEVASIFAKKS